MNNDLLMEVLEPVLDWYQSDAQPPRDPMDILRDVISDLQEDRKELLAEREARKNLQHVIVSKWGADSIGACIATIREVEKDIGPLGPINDFTLAQILSAHLQQPAELVISGLREELSAKASRAAYTNPLSPSLQAMPIQAVLRALASQEGCDGPPWDQMIQAADYIDALEKSTMREATVAATKFRAGDEVHHAPSGEDWLLAGDEENGKVQPCGWPESIAEAKDCSLIEAATDEERLAMLNEWAKKGKGYEHERDSRTRTARRQLEGAK